MNQIPTKRPPSQGKPQPRPQGRPSPRPQGRPPTSSSGQKYQGRPIRLPQKCAAPKALVIATTLTAILLVISIITVSIALIVGTLVRDESGGSDGGGGGKKKQTQGVEDWTPTGPQITANFLTFPSPTASGSYVSAIPSNVATDDASLRSEAALLVDVSAGTALFAKSANVKIYPASMTKVMTLLVACEHASDPTELLTITSQMITDLQASGGASTLGGWQAGDQITVEDALFLVNYKSDTVACWLLAERFGGGEAGFVAKMNQKAKAIGLTGTNFTNCTGLHHENHYTTCQDMAAIMQAAMNNPAAKQVLSAYEPHSVQVYREGIPNRAPSMYAAWYSERLNDYNWVGRGSDLKIMGGKTGWETIPKSCFVTMAQDTEHPEKWYICVTVGRISGGAAVTENECATDTRYLYSKYANGRDTSWSSLSTVP